MFSNAGSPPEQFAGKLRDPDFIISLSGQETTALVDCVQTWRYTVDARQHGFFLAKKIHILVPTYGAKKGNASEEENLDDKGPMTPGKSSDTLHFNWSIGSLAEYERGFFDGVAPEDQYVCFADPSTYSQYPGWMLRNLLVLVRKRWKLDRLQVLCYRDVQARRDAAKSIILPLEVRESGLATSSLSGSLSDGSSMPKVTGWERNNLGKVMSRVANLGEYMDPQRYVAWDSLIGIRLYLTLSFSDNHTSLADQAVDLNLKLIKWRIAPTLDLKKIKKTKCLLLGAGTLGSYVARNLMVRQNPGKKTRIDCNLAG